MYNLEKFRKFCKIIQKLHETTKITCSNTVGIFESIFDKKKFYDSNVPHEITVHITVF
jgi:hypothetical protein